MSGAATIAGWAEDARRFADQWPNRGAAVVGERIERVLRADTGGDGRLSNLDGGEAAVAIEEGSGQAETQADGNMGLWAMLEHGTTRHSIHPTRTRALLTPRGPRRFVTVAGMNASQTWTKGAAMGLTEAARDAEQAWGEAF